MNLYCTLKIIAVFKSAWYNELNNYNIQHVAAGGERSCNFTRFANWRNTPPVLLILTRAKHHVRVKACHGYVEHCCTDSESAPVACGYYSKPLVSLEDEAIHVRVPQVKVAIFSTGYNYPPLLQASMGVTCSSSSSVCIRLYHALPL